MSFALSLLRNYWRCGPLIIGTAALSFSFTALVIKFVGDSVPPFETVSVSGLLCLFALTGLVWRQGLALIPTRKYLDPSSPPLDCTATNSFTGEAYNRFTTARVTFLTLLRGVFGAVATTAFILSLELLSLKDAVTLFFTSPVIALLLDWLLMGRSPGCGGAAATALTLGGALLVTQPPFLFGSSIQGHSGAGHEASRGSDGDDGSGGGSGGEGDGLSSVGVALALLAAAANASGFLTINLLKGRQPPLVLTWWYNLVLAVLTSVPLALRWPLPPVVPSRRELLLLAAVGGTQLVAQLCLNRGFQLEPAGRGAAINVLQVLFSFILDVAVLGDMPTVLSVCGSSLVATGVLFVALSGSSRAGGRLDDAAAGGGAGRPNRSLTHGRQTGGAGCAAAEAFMLRGADGVCAVVVDEAADELDVCREGGGGFWDPRVTAELSEPLLSGAEPKGF